MLLTASAMMPVAVWGAAAAEPYAGFGSFVRECGDVFGVFAGVLCVLVGAGVVLIHTGVTSAARMGPDEARGRRVEIGMARAGACVLRCVTPVALLVGCMVASVAMWNACRSPADWHFFVTPSDGERIAAIAVLLAVAGVGVVGAWAIGGRVLAGLGRA
ncbi:MAG: hypothetical protein RBS39_00555 [Phycisphaerales bacterium]|nr:hypothetical protein [Phycisphaerales bacterium]